jgi:hypothetical protein
MFVATVAFVFIFGGALLGIFLRRAFPEQHLNSDTRDIVRVGTGLIATLSALVLGLLIASAQSALQTQSNQIKQITANVILLDNMLARSGADAQPVRALLRSGVQSLVGRIWREQDAVSTRATPFEAECNKGGKNQRVTPAKVMITYTGCIQWLPYCPA